MEPAEITTSHLAPRPVRGGDGITGAEEREEVGPSCDSLISLRQSSAATQQPGCSTTCPVKQPPPTCSVLSDEEGDPDADGCAHVPNGLPDGGQLSEKLTSCPQLGPTPVVETGFADLILFLF